MKALVVEDRPELRGMIVRWLQAAGIEVVEADSMAVAREHITEAPAPMLVTLDLNLPDSGMELTIKENIRKIREQLPDAVIVVLSGVATAEDEARVIAAGADAFVQKMDASTQKTFFEKLAQLSRSLLSGESLPKTGVRNTDVLEVIAQSVTAYLRTLA